MLVEPGVLDANVLAFPGLHVLPAPARAVVGWMELLRRHPSGIRNDGLDSAAIEDPTDPPRCREAGGT